MKKFGLNRKEEAKTICVGMAGNVEGKQEESEEMKEAREREERLGKYGAYGRIAVFENGADFDERIFKEIANKVVKYLVSELPEEVQTYEGAEYTLRKAKEQLGTLKFSL